MPMHALITGGAAGIGRAVAVEFVRSGGRSVTIVDLPTTRREGHELQAELQAAGADCLFIEADVCQPRQLQCAFDAHQRRFGTLDLCVLNAGIGEPGDFLKGGGDEDAPWRRVLDVDLAAVIDGTRLAVRQMRAGGGDVILVASAAGLFPMKDGPVYAAAKAGVVQLARSLEHLSRQSPAIRCAAFCPQFVDTALVARGIAADLAFERTVKRTASRVMTPSEAAAALLTLVGDPAAAGRCLFMNADTGAELWPPRQGQVMRNPQFGSLTGAGTVAKPRPPRPSGPYLLRLADWATARPQGAPYKKLIVHALGSDFDAATRVETCLLPSTLPPGGVLVRVAYSGVNASDVNASAGRYFGAAGSARVPFDAGFEWVGCIAALGEAMGTAPPWLVIGAPVACMSGGYAEYVMLPSHRGLLPIAEPSREAVAILVSGLTASIALTEAGRVRSGETVLITAAAGGTGQFAVQLAKRAGARVIATCGGPTKAALLKRLGADIVLDHRAGDVGQRLASVVGPAGVDVVYESVGGPLFETCLRALATRGRLLIIGMISQYGSDGSGWQPLSHKGVPDRLLTKSASLVGFFLPHYARLYGEHLDKLTGLVATGALAVELAPTGTLGTGPAAAPAAVRFLHSGASAGKVVLQMCDAPPPLEVVPPRARL